MFLRHFSLTERRRRLAKKVDLQRLETRNTITEPISVMSLAVSALRGAENLGIILPYQASNALSGLVLRADVVKRIGHAAKPPVVVNRGLLKPVADIGAHRGAGGGGSSAPATSETAKGAAKHASNDWLTLNTIPAANASDAHGISSPWQPAKRPGGGAALPPRGGSSASGPARPSTRGAITPLRLPASTPAASNAGGSSAALLAAVAGASSAGAAAASAGTGGAGATTVSTVHAAPGGSPGQSGQSGQGTGGGGITFSAAGVSGGGGGASGGTPLSSIPDLAIGNSSGASMNSFAYFPMYVLDNDNGVVLYPGVEQFATLGKNVDLIAQVSGTTVSSYDWNTTSLANATHISATNTDQLTFQWTTNNPTGPSVSSVTLSVTDINNHSETFTYDFYVPLGSGTAQSGGSSATWPTSVAPSQELLSAPSFSSNNATVDATSGSLDTEIDLPSYNPNVPALSLAYDSIAANPEPIIIVENTIGATVPSQVSAQLTFNGGTPLTTYYYSASGLNPGDVQQISLQATNATGLATGRYSYSIPVTDVGSTPTTYTGTTTLLNYSGNAFGAGWTLEGLEKITSASGGVILDEGDGGMTLWFASSGGSGGSGGTYTAQPGEFSTLVKNSGGGYTQTLPDGDQIVFNSGGYETATIDLDGNHITYTYNGSNNLSTITDNYGNITSFSYNSGGYLQSIEDPASRFTTFTHSGSNLTGVTLPDSNTWGYSYASGGQLTQITDPNSHTSTIVYDSAGRVATISQPDSTTEKFTNDQESGWTNSGTSGSPAAATLLAQAGSTFTSPNGNPTTIQPSWNGLGMAGNVIDALGDVQLFDLNSNGLATVAIDQVNRNTQYSYDSKGNITETLFDDGNSQSATYNSDSQPLTITDANNNTTSFTYSGGNLTVVEDPLGNLTSMTYTATGRLKTLTDANNKVTSYQYDNQDRVTTVQFPNGTTNLYSYNSQGNETKFVDGRGNATTYSYDAMNRETGSTDALNNLTTLTYDSGGNLIKDQEPTPAGQTARTTTYAYDSMDRLTTVTDPMGLETLYGYDADGNNVTVKDDMGRVTTTIFDDLDRPTVVIDSMTNRTTTVYDGDSEVIQTVDPMGRVTTTTYDNRGWVATETDGLGNVVTYSYTPTGMASTVTNPTHSGGAQQDYTYDKDDRLIAETDANGDTTSFAYDGVGNQISVTDANNDTTSYAYDSMNQLTTVTDALGDTTVYGYDSGGNQISVTDGLGHTATTLYDALNRPTTMISAISGTTTISYDAAGREISLTDPVGNETQWAYDADDRVTTLTQPNGATVTYVYDNDNELTDTTDADGRRTTYSYNADGDQTGETWVGSSPSEVITYTYDADNELTGAADSFATLTFTYDSGGNEITSATSGPGTGQPSVTLASGYDAQHSLTSVSDSISGNAGLTTYQYDAGERLTTITTSYGGTAGPQVVTTYEPNNQISAQSRSVGGTGTAVNTTYMYDAADRQTTITDYVSGGSALATYIYNYDKADRVTTMVDSDGNYTYTYDNSDELTNVDKNGTQVESYSYDLNGNRTGTGYSTTVMNETLTSPGVTYTYDKSGNMISADSGGTFTTYTYDYRSRLTEVTQGGTVIATYTYNALDQRIGVQEAGSRTWTVYNGTSADATPYADFNGSGTLLTRYLYGPGVINGAVVDEILARTSSGGTTAWYLPDKLGSVRDIVSSSGSLLDHIVYDSFGNIVTETNASNGDRFKFAAMQFDSTTGQYFDNARWYGPTTGRFVEQDPLGLEAGDPDLYRYVNNGPTYAVDPSGEFWNILAGAAIGAALNTGIYLLTNPNPSWKGAAVAAGSGAVAGAVAAATGVLLPPGTTVLGGAAVGAVTGATGGAAGSVVSQLATTGGVSVGQVAQDAAVGALIGGVIGGVTTGLRKPTPASEPTPRLGTGLGQIACFVAGTPVLTSEPPGGAIRDNEVDTSGDADIGGGAFVAVAILAAGVIPLVAERMLAEQGREVRGSDELGENLNASGDDDENRRSRSPRGKSRRSAKTLGFTGAGIDGAPRDGAGSSCRVDYTSPRRPPWGVRRTWRVAGLAACLLLATLFAGRAASHRIEARKIVGGETRFEPFARPIETIRVGQRVLTSAGQSESDESQRTSVDVATWRRLRLRADNSWPDGTPDVIEVETLQPPQWIEANHAQPGSFVPLPLDLEEMGLRRGTVARVIANEPCPALEHGPGRAVLTTVNHLNNDVCELVVADASGRTQRILATGLHKFYSASRDRWVSTEGLEPGERLNGKAGAVVVRSVAHVPGVHRVYNMTVETEHTYRVSILGVLVHNNGCAADPPPLTNPAGQKPPSAPVGTRTQPMPSVSGNSPANINGRDFTAHALDRMQGRGIPPSVVEDSIQPQNYAGAGNSPETSRYFSADNNITTVIDSASGRVITVW